MENIQQTEQNTVQENALENTQPQDSNPVSDLILGKFKSVEDLTNAYKKMETQQGLQSKELGDLRKKAEFVDKLRDIYFQGNESINSAKSYIEDIVPRYDKEEYFQNSEFTNLYNEAFKALGTNLDTEKFVSLLDNYVQSRLNMFQKAKSADLETEDIKSQMQFSDSPAKSEKQRLPKLDTLDPKQIDEYVAKYI